MISFFLSSLLLSAYVHRPYLQHLWWYLLRLFLIHRVETFLVSKVLLKEIAGTRACLRYRPCIHVYNVPFKPDLEWSSRRKEIGGGRLLHSFRLVNCCVWEEQQSKCFLTMCTYTEDAGGVIAAHFHRDVAWFLIRFTGKTQQLGYTVVPQLSVSACFFQPECAFCCFCVCGVLCFTCLLAVSAWEECTRRVVNLMTVNPPNRCQELCCPWSSHTACATRALRESLEMKSDVSWQVSAENPLGRSEVKRKRGEDKYKFKIALLGPVLDYLHLAF